VSFAKSIYGLAMGFEASYRHNTALQSVGGFAVGTGGENPVTSASPAGPNIPLGQTPDYKLVEGARGDTFHFVANASSSLKPSFLYDTASVAAELTYQHLDKVTKNPNLFNAEDYACKFGYFPTRLAAGARDKTDGCSTRDAWATQLVFVPQWTQPFPGLALSMPISVGYGISGNSPALSGNFEGAYRWSIGLSGTYQSRYEFAIAINDSYQKYKTTTATSTSGLPGEQIFSTAQGSTPIQNNHRWLSVRFKTSF
jgi:hypothetical protein